MTDVAIADPELHTGEEPILREATFNPKVRTYWLLTWWRLLVELALMVLIIGIAVFAGSLLSPLGAPFLTVSIALILTVLVVGIAVRVGYTLMGRYLKRLRCVLTEKNLHVARGGIVRLERTIPLDQITDLAMYHGPIMRLLGLRALEVGTAGGHGIRLIGIEGTEEFRAAVLAQRERVGGPGGGLSAASAATAAEGEASVESAKLLSEIRDSLLRIERRLGDGGGG